MHLAGLTSFLIFNYAQRAVLAFKPSFSQCTPWECLMKFDGLIGRAFGDFMAARCVVVVVAVVTAGLSV